MKSSLEKLMQEAGERLKELQNQNDHLTVSSNELEKRRAGLYAIVNKSNHNVVQVADLCEVVERLKTTKEQLAINRDNLLDQRNYVLALTDRYMELVMMEMSTPAPAKNQSSEASDFTMFPRKPGSVT